MTNTNKKQNKNRLGVFFGKVHDFITSRNFKAHVSNHTYWALC